MAGSVLASMWSALRRRLASQSGRGLVAASIWQLANYAIPLLTFPYLARVLGVEGFGLIGLASAILAYAGMVTDWGFGYSGTRDVARHKDDPQAVRRIVWSIILAKAVLALLSTLVLGLGLFVTPAVLWPVLLAGLFGLFVSVFNVEWALRGVERLGSFARGSIIGRLAAVPFVYLLVRSEDDVALAMLVAGLGSAFTAALYGYELNRIGLLGRPVFDVRRAWEAARDGAHLFLSTAAMSLYTGTITVVLGMMTGPMQVGLYAGAGRIKAPVQSLLSPISMVFFPRMSAVSAADPEKAAFLARRLLLVQGGLALLLSVALTVTAPVLVHLLLGSAFDEVVPVLRVMAWTIFLVGISNVTGIMIMIPFDMKRQFTRCLILGAVVGLTTVIPLSYSLGALGAAVAALLSEVAVTVSMLVVLARRFAWMRPWAAATATGI